MDSDAISISGQPQVDEILSIGAGDTAALCELADLALLRPDWARREALVAAEAFASLAAASGSPRGQRKLAAVLLLRSHDHKADDPERAVGFWWRAAELLYPAAKAGDVSAASLLLDGLDEQANAGDEDAATTLIQLVEVLQPQTLASASLARCSSVGSQIFPTRDPAGGQPATSTKGVS